MKNTFYSKYLLFVLLIIPLLLSVKDNRDKIPITTSSEEARKDYIKARDLFERLKVNEALKYLDEAIAKDKNFALAYYLHAQVDPTTKGFFQDVARAAALTDKVSKGEKLMILALKGSADGNTKVQEENLTELVKEYPNDERAEFLLGTFYYGQQMYDKAITHLKKSTEIAPDYSGGYNLLGYAYRSTNQYPEAEKTFQKYIELLPNDPNPYDSYAELLLKEGKYQESINQYRKALSIDPEFHASYNGLSTAYTFLRKYDDARKELNSLFDNARNDGEKRTALYGMTVAYADEGKLDKALELMQKQYDIADKEKDNGAMAGDLNAMGNILFEQGKFDAAMKKYDEAQKLTIASGLSDEVKENAKNFNLYNDARILLMKNDLKAAKVKSDEFALRAKKANNTNLEWLSHQLKGQIALQEKDYKKALTELKMASRQDPYTYYYLGMAYQGAGDVEKAKEAFKTASSFNNLNNLNQAFVREKAEKMIAVK